MRAARMHAYNQPLVLEDVLVPEIEPNEAVVKVGAGDIGGRAVIKYSFTGAD